MNKPGSHQKGVTLDLKKEVNKVAPDTLISFLKGIMPFNELDDETLAGIAHHCRVEFFPAGTRLLTGDETQITHLFLIQQGGVKAFITDEEGEVTLKDYRGEGAYIGALGIIRGEKASLDIETVEDTFCYLLPREIFLDLVRDQPGFAHYYLKSFSDKIVRTAYRELRHHKVTRRSFEDLYLFSIKAGEIVKAPYKVSVKSTIQEAAKVMSHYSIGSLLIHDQDDEENIVGIITDRDLRSKVVSAGLSYQQNVDTIMSTPVLSVSSETVCFDVLLRMMSTGIHHLAVERGANIIGVITTHDITVLQGSSPFYLFKEIISQRQIDDIYPLARKIPDMIRNLIKEGGKASNIMRMIAILNDQILAQILSFLEKELGPPPVSFCWLLFGSEGRREQTFKTDQDNGIVYADPEDESQRKEAEKYFHEFGVQAIKHLVNCGYPLRRQKIMASNRQWCQPYSVWKDFFSSCVNEPEANGLGNVTIFFDFRSGYGDESLAAMLRNHFQKAAQKKQMLLMYLTRQTAASHIPLSFFKNFIVERDGEHKNQLDIKQQGIEHFVDFARIMALKYGVREMNTMARLQALNREGHLESDLYTSIIESYELQMQMWLVHQLEMIEDGILPDDYIAPTVLTELEKLMLKDTFGVIEKLHNTLVDMFPVI